MKRYDCTMHDKRGAFGLCMEARSEGQFVPFTKVEQLQAKIFGLLEERNSTGIAINNAIRSGILPDKHPLRSRLELLANHHKHAHSLADTVVKMGERCTLLADLLREAKEGVYFQLESPDSNLTGVEAGRLIDLQERIDTALTGKQPEISDKSDLAMMMDELHDFCVGLDVPGGAQNGAEAWEQVKAARDRVLAGKLPEPALPQLSYEEHAALARFKQCCEDDQGYDVDKDMMVKLARKGALHHRSAGYYEVTEAGSAMLAAAPKPQGGEPCDTASPSSSQD